MNPFWFVAIFAGYFLGFAFYFIHFEFQKNTLAFWAKKVTVLTLLSHLAFLGILVLEKHLFIIASLSEYLYVLSFLIALISFYTESRYRTRHLMLFSLPIVLLLCFLAILLTEKNSAVQASTDPWWLWLHIGLIFTGLASIAVSVSSAVMYLLQSAQLKSKHLGKIFLALPSIDALDRLHFRSLIWGVILFSLGILSGLFWAGVVQESKDVFKDPQVILSFLVCATYWVVLSLRLSALRRGQKIAYSTVLIFSVLCIALVTSYFCPAGIHKGF